MQTQAKLAAAEKKRHPDGGYSVTLELEMSPERARELLKLGNIGDVLTVDLKKYEMEPDSPAKWLSDRIRQVAEKSGRSSSEVRNQLLRTYGTADKLLALYAKRHDLLALYSRTAPYMCVRHIEGHSFINREGVPYEAVAQIKPVPEHQGEEMERLLRGMNQILEEYDLGSLTASQALIDFFVNPTERRAIL